MPNKSRAETNIRITTAATLFATHTRDANEIATLLKTSARNVHRWAERQLWDDVLQTLGYEGERNFRVHTQRDAQRDAGTAYQIAKDAYFDAIKPGKPQHTWASYAAAVAGLSWRRVNVWAKKYHWRDET